MKLTYTDLKSQYLRNIGQVGSTDSSILADFNINLAQRYQVVLAKLHDYMTQNQKTTTTVINQQYYHYPVGITRIESVVVTIGSINYPTTFVNSQWQWDWLNSFQVQPTAIPQFIFPRRSDFGIYPKPQDTYTLTFNYNYRDRSLSVEDYTAGTVTVTNGSQTVTGSGTTFTSAMANRWLQITDTTNTGQGYWYRVISVESATSLTLETAYDGASGASLTYRIGECPEFPDEGHIILADGATADFYSGIRHDINTATWFNNKFWTGDGQNSSREEGKNTIKGGLIGLADMYTDRNQERVIDRKKQVYPFMDQNFGLSLSQR